MLSGEEIVHCLSEPRELCKHCYNWLTQEDVGFNSFPGCSESTPETRSYLFGKIDTCSRFLDL